MTEPSSIKDLRPDQRNARKHNPRNIGMIERSLQEVGAARSIVIDEHNNILAGNGTIEAAAQAGIERVQIVDADGETIIAVRRRGLTPEQKQRLALFDNRSAETAEWDTEVLASLLTEDRAILDGMWSDDEANLLIDRIVADSEWQGAFGALPDGDKAPFQQMTFTLSDEQAEQVKAALEAAKRLGPFADTGNENSNGNALARICETFLGIR